MTLKGPPSVAASEFGGVRLRRTRFSRHLEDDACGWGASGKPGRSTTYRAKGAPSLARTKELVEGIASHLQE